MNRGHLALSLSVAVLSACSDSSTEFWLSPNDLSQMVALDDRVAYIERTSGTAFVLTPAEPSLTPRLVPVGERPINAVKHVGSNRLLVVSAGKQGSAKAAPVPAKLTIVDPVQLDAQDPAAEPAWIPLTGRFDGLAQSEEGNFAVLYHTSAAQAAAEAALFNPNEMVVLDFSAGGIPTPTPKSIRSMGGVPSTSNPLISPIWFSPVYSFQAGPRRLAVVLSQNYVTIFDLFHLDRSEISVPLCPAAGTCSYTADQVVFDPTSLSIYLRATGARDIFQVTLTDLGPAGASPGGNDFLASISMLAVGASPADMALYGTGASARLAVVAPDARSLVIIDPKTGRSLAVAMPITATNIVPFAIPSQDPASPQPRNRAMLVDLQRSSTSVVFADLESVETAGGSSLDRRAIPGPVGRVTSLPAQGVVILVYSRSSNNAVLSVVTLADRPSFFDFSSSRALGSAYLEVRDGGISARLWSVDSPDDGSSAPGSGIRYLDLVTNNSEPPSPIWLDQTITSITALPKPSADGRRYLVLEQLDPDLRGNLTFLDAENPDRASARTAYGFLFTNYLGRTEP